jgi:pimeloyl-ACP methyl ester carboxylesterase
MSSTIVLVHGAWHGAWCWDRVAAPSREQGLAVVAVDLPGHGLDPRPLGDLHGDAAAVREVLDTIEGDVVLVGHSYGGAVITEAGAHPAVRRLVYLAAFCIDEHETCATAGGDDPRLAAMSHEGRPSLAEAFVIHDDGSITLTPDGAAVCLYNDCDQASIDWALAHLSPQPMVTFTQSPTVASWRTRPATYVVCDHDQGVHPDLQRLMAERCADTVTWPADHSPFLSDPTRVIDLLADLAG